mmetsp:Transcript_24773/g.27734  ORF Transcript_24773/g.27734 Transcript_24773/m.27734 type:complete len:139 (+) Transcript_24773:110-526(+)
MATMATFMRFDGEYQVATIDEQKITDCDISFSINNGSMIVRIENWSFETTMNGNDALGNQRIHIFPSSSISSVSGTTHADLKNLLIERIPSLGIVMAPCGRGNLYLSTENMVRPRFEMTMRTSDAVDPMLELNRILGR